MKSPTLDQLISDIEAINKSVNLDLPYNLHGFLHKLTEHGLLIEFELWLRDYRRSRGEK